MYLIMCYFYVMYCEYFVIILYGIRVFKISIDDIFEYLKYIIIDDSSNFVLMF